MRPIKFRVWDLDDKKMYLVDKLTTMEWVTYTSRHTKGKGNVVVMQFSGILDKNDKEIYEGDICSQYHDGQYFIGKMIFNENRSQFGLETIVTSKVHKKYGDYIVKKESDSGSNFLPEVIGNIYENPELLK